MNLDYNKLLELGTTYGVPLLKALAILVVGWVAAKGISIGTKKLLDRTELDNKLAAKITGGKTTGMAIEAGVSRFVYWLVMLFVLMAVLEALGLTVVTAPINAFVTKILGFLPQVLAAVVLAAIAWAVASVLRVVVANLLGAFQIDEKLGEKAGAELKKVSLASTLADAVYYLVWLLFLPQIIDALQMEGLSPVKEMVGQILGFLPSLFGALIIFSLFYVVARIVQRLATSLLAGVGFDRLPEWLGLGASRSGAGSASADRGVRHPRHPPLPGRRAGLQDPRPGDGVDPRRAAAGGAVQHRRGRGDLRRRPLPEPDRLQGHLSVRRRAVGAAGQHRPRGHPDLHRRDGACSVPAWPRRS